MSEQNRHFYEFGPFRLDPVGKGVPGRSNYLTYLKVFPILDPLRSDPRFVDLVRAWAYRNNPATVTARSTSQVLCAFLWLHQLHLPRQFRRCLWSRVGIFRECAHDSHRDASRYREDDREWRRWFLQVPVDHTRDSLSFEGPLTGQHLVEHHPETVNIRTNIEWLTQTLFRRHVKRCPHYRSGRCGIRVRE